MATASSSANVEWAGATRAAIGRPRRGAETRTEQTALPDKDQLAMASRLTKLKDKIDELTPLVSASAIGVVQTKYELLKRSLLGGNAATMETPLSQLESTVAQLLVQSKPKPKPIATAPVPPVSPAPTPVTPAPTSASGGPKRTPPPPPPRPQTPSSPPPSTPPSSPAPTTPVSAAPVPSAPPQPARMGTTLKDKLDKLQPMIQELIPDGGAATALQGEFDTIKAATSDPSKHAECLAKLELLEPRIATLKRTVEAARLAAAKTKVTALGTAPANNASFTPVDTRAKAAIAAKTVELTALLKAGSENQDQNIHRDVMLGLTSSKDQSYIDNVQKPCDAALKAVADAVTAKKPIKPTLTKRLEHLLTQLDEQRAHYADKTGITDRALITQRDSKVAAIDKRKVALSAAIAKVVEIAKVQETEEAGGSATPGEPSSKPMAPMPP